MAEVVSLIPGETSQRVEPHAQKQLFGHSDYRNFRYLFSNLDGVVKSQFKVTN